MRLFILIHIFFQRILHLFIGRALVPVSYTHLDVYKRQRRRPSFQKLTLSRMTDRLSFSESLAGAKSSTLSCMLKICFLFSIPSLSSRLFQLDPRIDDLVHDVHDHVHRDDERGQEDRGSHDDHIIAAGDGADEAVAQARDRKDLFNDQAARERIGQSRPQISDDRQNGIAQRMLKQALALGKTCLLYTSRCV